MSFLPFAAVTGLAKGVKSLFSGSDDKSKLPGLFNNGQVNQSLLNQLSLSDADADQMINDLYKVLQTQSNTNRNSIVAEGARNDLPSDVLSAQMRGNQINTGQSLQSGVSGILNQQKLSKIDAMRMLLSLQFGRDESNAQRNADRVNALINGIFQAASAGGQAAAGGG